MAGSAGHELALRAGLASYKPAEQHPWDAYYRSGILDYYGALEELPRYAILLGYLRFLGGNPAILDVGCGVGLLRARIGGIPFARYVGIDISAEAIAQANEMADDRTTFLVAPSPTGAPGPFDVVVLNEVLYYQEDPGRFLDEVYAALRPGGHLLTSIYRHRHDWALHEMIDARFQRVDVVLVCDENAGRARRALGRGYKFRLALHRRRGPA
ncbi:MAG: class I SAM-dependent methyltransferase [Actinomycetota bacterium]|nr:class I SAM-dependent methyltransferase [Actinomycetota bacterium]